MGKPHSTAAVRQHDVLLLETPFEIMVGVLPNYDSIHS